MGKTNTIRILDSRKISYELQEYKVDESDLSAVSVASKAGIDIDLVFKTLVLRSSNGEIFVCVIPGDSELNLKKFAIAAGVKKADLVPQKEILSLTGYIRGGCSPIGMKKKYPTYIDEVCQLYDAIYISAGIRGLQILIAPDDLIELVGAEKVDLV